MIGCHECGEFFWSKRVLRIRCLTCKHSLLRKRTLVLKWVELAVKRGDLTNLKTTNVACVDCGGRASVYDHRDYNKPLDVVPVCPSCNAARGPAAPHRRNAA